MVGIYHCLLAMLKTNIFEEYSIIVPDWYQTSTLNQLKIMIHTKMFNNKLNYIDVGNRLRLNPPNSSNNIIVSNIKTSLNLTNKKPIDFVINFTTNNCLIKVKPNLLFIGSSLFFKPNKTNENYFAEREHVLAELKRWTKKIKAKIWTLIIF